MDRADRDAKARRDVLCPEVALEAERDDHAVIRRQRSQSRFDHVAIVGAGVGITGGDHELVGDVGRPLARCTREAVAALVDEDPIEPGLEAVGIAEGRPLPPGLDERIMRCVLGVRTVAEDRIRQAVRPIEMLVRQPPKRSRGGSTRAPTSTALESATCSASIVAFTMT